jgi:methionyl-tRNA formyltransferase
MGHGEKIMSSKTYIVLGCKPWCREAFEKKISKYPGKWHYFEKKEELSLEKLSVIKPEYLFFLHWSWLVPEKITEQYNCVCFHMADVPYGRGGSPLQNLIVRGHKDTKLTALRMVKELDAGPVYMKKSMGLEGSAGEIYVRANFLAAGMIKEIIEKNPNPQEQNGEAVIFERRRPEEGRIPEKSENIEKLYDFIRMLDADSYPKAFLEYGNIRIEFNGAELAEDGELKAGVVIRKTDNK